MPNKSFLLLNYVCTKNDENSIACMFLLFEKKIKTAHTKDTYDKVKVCRLLLDVCHNDNKEMVFI